ncbi:hypothetical protein, partial [Mycolicibacterium palauense]|uniref:hypothetical protein n=1 Tax=Mycolicibacterium palauense TaxID=2034511 RepID=UPI001C3F379D
DAAYECSVGLGGSAMSIRDSPGGLLRITGHGADGEPAPGPVTGDPEQAPGDAERLDGEPVSGPIPQSGRRRVRISAPRLRVVLVAAAVAVLCALLGLSATMAWQHRGAEAQRQRDAEYAAVARQGVVNLMSLDFTNAEENINRVIDSATGQFKEDFQAQSGFLVKALEESKVVTDVTVNSVAVESADADSAVVLVAAKSQASNAKDARRDPQQFRVAVTLASDGGEFKISQVDFL